MSAGVARQCTGTAGRIENCQVGVFAAYVTPDGGRALIDRELYLPQKWADDRDRCRAAGIGDGTGFATKPELARTMIERSVKTGLPFSWVAGDEVYGGNPKLRAWLEEDCFAEAKGEAGLDHYQVRKYRAWYRHAACSTSARASPAPPTSTSAGHTGDAATKPPPANPTTPEDSKIARRCCSTRDTPALGGAADHDSHALS